VLHVRQAIGIRAAIGIQDRAATVGVIAIPFYRTPVSITQGIYAEQGVLVIVHDLIRIREIRVGIEIALLHSDRVNIARRVGETGDEVVRAVPFL
jgi:hypothetical protein